MQQLLTWRVANSKMFDGYRIDSVKFYLSEVVSYYKLESDSELGFYFWLSIKYIPHVTKILHTL